MKYIINLFVKGDIKMKGIEKIINWAVTIATAVAVAIEYVITHLPN